MTYREQFKRGLWDATLFALAATGLVVATKLMLEALEYLI